MAETEITPAAESEIMPAAATSMEDLSNKVGKLEASVNNLAKLGSVLRNLFGWANIGSGYLGDGSDTSNESMEAQWTSSNPALDWENKYLSKSLQGRMDSLDNEWSGKIDTLSNSLDGKMGQLQTDINAQFDNIDNTIGSITNKIGDLWLDIYNINENMETTVKDAVDTRVDDKVDSVLGTLGSRVSVLEGQVKELSSGGVGKNYGNDISALKTKVQSLSNNLTTTKTNLANLESRHNLTEYILGRDKIINSGLVDIDNGNGGKLKDFLDWLSDPTSTGLIGTVYNHGLQINELMALKNGFDISAEISNQLTPQVTDIYEKIGGLSGLIIANSEDILVWKSKLDELNNQVNIIRTTSNTATGNANAALEKADAIGSTVVINTNRITSLDSALDSLKGTVETNIGKLSTIIDHSIPDLKSSLKSLKGTVETNSGILTSLDTRLDGCEKSISNLLEAKDNLIDLNTRIGSIESSIGSVSISELDSTVKCHNSSIGALQDEMKKLVGYTGSNDETIIGGLNDKINQLGSDITDLTSRDDELQASVNNLDTTVNNLRGDLSSLTESVDTNSGQISEIFADLDKNYAKKDDLDSLVKVDEYDELKEIVSNHAISITNNDSKCTNIDTRVNELAAGVRGELEVHSKNIEALDSSLKDLNEIVSLNSSNIDGIKQDLIDNYLKREDIPNLPDYEPGADIEEFNNLKNSVTTNTNAIAEVSDRVDGLSKVVVENHKNTQNSIASTQGMIVSSISGVQHNIEELTKKTDKLTTDCDELNKVTQDHTNKLDGWEETVEGSTIQHKGVIRDLSDFKQHVEDTYAKPEDISSLLNSYSPDVSYKNKWVGVETAGNLVGKTGEEIALERHSYSSVLDQIIFVDYEPTVSEPSADVALKEDWDGGMSVDWYDKEKRIILVKDGSVGPDGGDFYPTNVVDAMISYPKNITLDPHFTNGPILSSDEKQTSVGFCKVQNENGDWDYYKKDDNIYHVPSTLEAGEYRYYIATYFTKGSPVINNNGLTVKEWDENTPIESKDYITIIASKPSYYTTPKGDVENPLQLWGDNMVDTMELLPSCQCIQQFRTPKPLKHLYIWNDLAGGYARVPSKDGVPAYMIGTIDENGYYKYSYDSDTFGHRGGIKVKIEF